MIILLFRPHTCYHRATHTQANRLDDHIVFLQDDFIRAAKHYTLLFCTVLH